MLKVESRGFTEEVHVERNLVPVLSSVRQTFQEFDLRTSGRI